MAAGSSRPIGPRDAVITESEAAPTVESPDTGTAVGRLHSEFANADSKNGVLFCYDHFTKLMATSVNGETLVGHAEWLSGSPLATAFGKSPVGYDCVSVEKSMAGHEMRDIDTIAYGKVGDETVCLRPQFQNQIQRPATRHYHFEIVPIIPH